MTTKTVEEVVEYVASICDEVEFLHGVPVKLPANTKALLRGRIREALAEREAGVRREAKNEEREQINEWIKKHSTFADPQPPQDESDERWEIHYAGYREAMNDMIDYLINSPHTP